MYLQFFYCIRERGLLGLALSNELSWDFHSQFFCEVFASKILWDVMYPKTSIIYLGNVELTINLYYHP